MRRLAREHGGTCLSDEYVNSHAKLQWRCREGHAFWKAPARVKQDGSWCPTCSPRQAVTLDRLRAAAAARGGRCPAKALGGAERKYEWECAKGHRWKAAASHVFHSGSWRPHCAGSAQMTIEQMRDLARGHGGRCLSRQYVNSRARLRWACTEGHRFEATPTAVLEGRWCLVCKRAASRAASGAA